MKVWGEKEKRFLHFPYKRHGLKLSVKIRLTAVIVIILLVIDHILSFTDYAQNFNQRIRYCNWTIEAPLSYFLEHQSPYIFKRIPFSLPLGIFVKIMNFAFVFGWNYMELFVMIFSIALATRFGQINDRLDTIKGKVIDVLKSLNETFNFLCRLCQKSFGLM